MSSGLAARDHEWRHKEGADHGRPGVRDQAQGARVRRVAPRGFSESEVGGAHELRRHLLESDAFIVSSPEYNGSMPGMFKNLIDWTSRFRPQPFDGKHGLLLSASPSMVGGNRGLRSLRMPLEQVEFLGEPPDSEADRVDPVPA